MADGYGIWDMGYGTWDMGDGMWDMAHGYGTCLWDMGHCPFAIAHAISHCAFAISDFPFPIFHCYNPAHASQTGRRASGRVLVVGPAPAARSSAACAGSFWMGDAARKPSS